MGYDDINKPKDKAKVIDMMEYVSQKSMNQNNTQYYTREDIEVMLRNIDLNDTYNADMASDFITTVVQFYLLGQDMGMSPFIARAALKELVDIAFTIAEDYSDCDGDCEHCEHKDEHNHK